MQFKMGAFAPPEMPARAQSKGARFSLRAHLCTCIFLRRGRFLDSVLEGYRFLHWSHSCSVANWGSGDLPPEEVS